MVLEALEDAGLTLADVDGVCHPDSAPSFAEYLGIHPVFTESTMTGGSSYEVHVEHTAAAIAAGVCDVVVSVYAATPRSDRKRARQSGGGGGRRGGARRSQPAGRVGPALRPAHADGSLRAGRVAPHVRVRHHRRATGADRREHPGVGLAQPAGPLPRPAHHRGGPGLALPGGAAPPARLLPGHRRRRRLRDDERRTGPLAAQATGVRARRRHRHGPHGHQPDARPDRDAGCRVGGPGLRHGRPRAVRRRRPHGLRQLHHHRPAPPRGSGLLPQGRGRALRGRRPPRARAARWP